MQGDMENTITNSQNKKGKGSENRRFSEGNLILYEKKRKYIIYICNAIKKTSKINKDSEDAIFYLIGELQQFIVLLITNAIFDKFPNYKGIPNHFVLTDKDIQKQIHEIGKNL